MDTAHVNEISDQINQALTLMPGPPPTRIVLGLSGGLDSMVLLHGLVKWRQQFPATEVQAIHVNHQLQADASHWQQHCQRECLALGVPLLVERVTVDSCSSSLERAARDARYGAFAKVVSASEVLMLAHHRDDQVETFLQRAARGSGPLGLAAMSPSVTVKGITILRPLLSLDREQLEGLANQCGVKWIDDPSNLDRRMERNFLRHEVLPLWRKFKPNLNQTLSRAARLCNETSQLLTDLAAIDAGAERQDQGLEINRLLGLSRSRQRNLLRYWLQGQAMAMPSEVVLDRIIDEAIPAPADAQPRVDWGMVSVRRFQGVLYVVPSSLDAEAAPVMDITLTELQQLDLVNAKGPLPNITHFSRRRLASAPLQLRCRQGGERLKLSGGQSKDLKDWFQKFAIPPWLRPHWPILYCGDDIAGVPGLLVCEGFEPDSPTDSLPLYWSRVDRRLGIQGN